MRIDEVMTPKVVTVHPGTTMPGIVELFLREDVSGAPVVEAGRVIGIVSEADLLGHEAYGHPPPRMLGILADLVTGGRDPWLRKATGTTARELMTTPVETIAPDDDTAHAARRMLLRGINRLPVVDHGRLVGIVTRQDLVRALDREHATA